MFLHLLSLLLPYFGSHSCLSSFLINSFLALLVFEDRAWGQRRHWSGWESHDLVLAVCCAKAMELFVGSSFTSIPFLSLFYWASTPFSNYERICPLLAPLLLSYLFINLVLPLWAALEDWYVPKSLFWLILI